MGRIFLCAILTSLAVGVWMAPDDDSKITIRSGLGLFGAVAIHGNDSSQEVSISVIQEDRKNPRDIIAAVGGAVIYYSSKGTVRSYRIGNSAGCGYEEGDFSTARFCNISGLAQLESPMIIIADTGNRCLRLYDMISLNITTYSGTCINGSLEHESTCEWTDTPLLNATFCSPSTLQYVEDQKRILVLDSRVSTNESAILNIDRYAAAVTTLYQADFLIKDFHYHPLENRLVVVAENGSLLNVKLYEEPTTDNIFAKAGDKHHCNSSLHSDPKWVKHMKAERLLEINGLYVVTDTVSGDVLLLDNVNDMYVPLSKHVDYGDITRPSSLAYVDGRLFIGNRIHFSDDKQTNELEIKRVEISVTPDFVIDPNCPLICCDDEWLTRGSSLETTTNYDPWTFNPYTWDPIIDDGGTTYSYTGYYYSGFGGCVFFVPCFYVYRKKRRAAVVRRQGLVVTTSSSNIPHHRLVEESVGPAPPPNKGGQALPTAKLPSYNEACETAAPGSSRQA